MMTLYSFSIDYKDTGNILQIPEITVNLQSVSLRPLPARMAELVDALDSKSSVP